MEAGKGEWGGVGGGQVATSRGDGDSHCVWGFAPQIPRIGPGVLLVDSYFSGGEVTDSTTGGKTGETLVRAKS